MEITIKFDEKETEELMKNSKEEGIEIENYCKVAILHRLTNKF